MLYAAKKANLDFILNIVVNNDKKLFMLLLVIGKSLILKVVNLSLNWRGVKSKPANIVITTNGDYPLDQNIYQSVKGWAAAEVTCKEGGVIITIS